MEKTQLQILNEKYESALKEIERLKAELAEERKCE